MPGSTEVRWRRRALIGGVDAATRARKDAVHLAAFGGLGLQSKLFTRVCFASN